LVLIGCSSPLSGVNPSQLSPISGVDDNLPPQTQAGDEDNTPQYPAGFEDFINNSIQSSGSLALNSVDFTSKTNIIDRYVQKEVVQNGYHGNVMEGQWLNGQLLSGTWSDSGTFVDGQWITGTKVENVIVAQGKYEGTQSIGYDNGKSIGKEQPLSDNLGTFVLKNDPNGGSNPKGLIMQLNLTDSYNKVVTVKITTTSNGTFSFHGIYQNGKVDNKDMGFSVLPQESNITFSISIENWDGTWSAIESPDGDPLFIVNNLVYAFDGKTVNGNNFYKVDDNTIYELDNGTDQVFAATNGSFVTKDAGFYQISDSSMFLFSGNGTDKIFKASDGTYLDTTAVEGVDYVNIDNGILVLDPEAPFVANDNGTDSESVWVNDLTKPIYKVITEKDFALEIAFDNEDGHYDVNIGTGSIGFDKVNTLTVTYTLDQAFTDLLASCDNWSLSCNGLPADDNNAVVLSYDKGTDINLESAIAFEVTEPVED